MSAPRKFEHQRRLPQGFRSSAERPQPRRVGDLRGNLRTYQRPGPGDRILRTWVSPGSDDVLRTVVLEGTRDDLGLFDRLLARIAFPLLDGSDPP